MPIKFGNDSYTPFFGSDEISTVYFGNDLIYQKVMQVDFATATWAQINAVAQAGSASTTFAVGDEKTIELTTGEEITLVIMGFNHDDLTAGGKAPITIGMKNLLATKHCMNSSSTNSGGWDQCYMRTTTMATLLSELPSDLQNVIKYVNKKASAGKTSTTITTSSDKLWLFSKVEIDGTTTNVYKDEGTQYDYWKTVKDGTINADRVKYLSNGTGSANAWWLRSPYTSNNSGYRAVSSSGSYLSPNAFLVSDGVCFGFCV